MMSFLLPEEDQEYLSSKGTAYELLVERMPDGNERRCALFPGFDVPDNLRVQREGVLAPCKSCEVLVIVPQGYATTKLDSFYTIPRLKRSDGTDPANANGEAMILGQPWQFWSRHLNDSDWRIGVDGFSTFLSYISRELRIA